MTDSILTTIKKMLGISEEYEHFDIDIITHINSTFSILAQLGVGPDKGFSIHDKTAKWSDYISDEDATSELVKTYVQLKVRMLFDPPSSNAVMESFNRTINELEFRLNISKSFE
jgi:hypothetical protein